MLRKASCTLRPYQQRLVSKAVAMFLGAYRNGADELEPAVRSVMIESPTGSGKTVCGLHIAKALQEATGATVGWVAMRRNLLDQAVAENRRHGIGVEMTTISLFEKSPPADLDLLVCDESQHDASNSASHLHNVIQPRWILGLTATPYRTDLRAKGCTTAHVSLVIARLRAVFTGTSATRIGDLQRADVEGWLAAQQQSGAMSAQTRKHYAAHLRQFGRFLLREGVVTEDPFKRVTLAVNVEADRRLQRRSLTTEELRKLLDTVGGSPKQRCLMSGPVRRLAYWTVATIGLRRNELGSLTPESFDFRGATPSVRVEARHAKNRRMAALPLRTDLAAELKAWLVDKPAGVPVFPVKGSNLQDAGR